MATTERSTVVGVFTDRAQAEHAIEELRRNGFRDDQIGFVAPDTRTTDQGVAAGVPKTKAGEGATAGAVTSGVVGGLLGAAAALLIPGIGPAIAGGFLIATLGGAAVGAAAGSLIGVLTGMGIPEEEARYYQGEVQAGHVLVTVRVDGHQEEAIAILRRNGAYDATTRAEAEAQVREFEPAPRKGPYSNTAPNEPAGFPPTPNPWGNERMGAPGNWNNPDVPQTDDRAPGETM